jgi:hypothetical protein
MSKSRAERRHHHQRMLNKVKKFSLYQNYFWSEEDKIQHQKRMAENRKPCSCHMCGNPRKHHKDKLTMQEKKMNEYEIE